MKYLYFVIIGNKYHLWALFPSRWGILSLPARLWSSLVDSFKWVSTWLCYKYAVLSKTHTFPDDCLVGEKVLTNIAISIYLIVVKYSWRKRQLSTRIFWIEHHKFKTPEKGPWWELGGEGSKIQNESDDRSRSQIK